MDICLSDLLRFYQIRAWPKSRFYLFHVGFCRWKSPIGSTLNTDDSRRNLVIVSLSKFRVQLVSQLLLKQAMLVNRSYVQCTGLFFPGCFLMGEKLVYGFLVENVS